MRELVEPRAERLVPSPLREGVLEPRLLLHDAVELLSLRRDRELEMVLGRAGPDVPDAVVRPGDPRALPGGDRLALARRRQLLAVDGDRRGRAASPRCN